MKTTFPLASLFATGFPDRTDAALHSPRGSRLPALLRHTLLAAGLAAGLGIGPVQAAAGDPAPVAHSATMTAAVADTAITAKVKGKLLGNAALKKSDISVTTTNGVVTLEGTATSPGAKMTAGTVTKAIEGVKSVDNNLVVAANSKTEAKANQTVAKTERVVSDSWITTKVKSELVADSASKGFKVHVKTTKGVVVLTGNLASADAVTHVKDIAGKIKGVKSVDASAVVIAAK